MKGKKQAFLLAVSKKGKFIVAGSDVHGTAYGIMELSRLIGVSPWEWWADAVPDKKDSFELTSGFRVTQAPDVEYRGIFINFSCVYVSTPTGLLCMNVRCLSF